MFTQEDYLIIHDLVETANNRTKIELDNQRYYHINWKENAVSEEKMEYQYKLDRLLRKLGKELK